MSFILFIYSFYLFLFVYLFIQALTRLFRAAKRWEWNVGILYAAGAVPSGSDVVNESRKFPQENSEKPPFVPSGNLAKSPIRSHDVSDLNETYSSVKRKPVHELVNILIDNHGDSLESIRDQTYIHECANTIGLTSLTFRFIIIVYFFF